MTAISFILNDAQEQPVSSRQPLPAAAIDGYNSATAYVATVNGGATAVALAGPGKAIDIFNNSGTDLEFRRGSATVYAPIPNGTFRTIAATGGNTISIRRIDQSATTVTVVYEVLT